MTHKDELPRDASIDPIAAIDEALQQPVKRQRVKGIHPLALMMVVVAFIVLFTQKMHVGSTPADTASTASTSLSKAAEKISPEGEQVASDAATRLAQMKERFHQRQLQREQHKDAAQPQTQVVEASQEHTDKAGEAAPSAVDAAQPSTPQATPEASSEAPESAAEPNVSVVAHDSAQEDTHINEDTGTTQLIAVTPEQVQQQQQQAQDLQNKINVLQAQLVNAHEQADHAHKQEVLLRLHVQVQTGQPFEVQLRSANALESLDAQERDVLAQAKTFAATGIPTRAQLLDAMTQHIRSWQLRPLPESATLWQKTWHNVAGLVRIRKIGEEHQGTDDGSRIARAEAHLQHGLYGRALAELGGLSAQSAPYFKEMMVSIQALQDAMAVVTGLQALVVAQPVELEKEQ